MSANMELIQEYTKDEWTKINLEFNRLKGQNRFFL